MIRVLPAFIGKKPECSFFIVVSEPNEPYTESMTHYIHANAPLIRSFLQKTDSHAQENVRSGKGGPFAAQLVLFARDGKGACHVYFALPVSTNRVLETGIASNHAEAQSLTAENIQSFTQRLSALRAEPDLAPVVVLFSSAQPCMACLTKIEIFARQLSSDGLINDQEFILIYGADYSETEEVAGFHDYDYALDFLNYKRRPETTHHVKIDSLPSQDVPDHVREVFATNPDISAVIASPLRILGMGQDRRTAISLFQTAACTAIHAASNTLRQEGSQTPWNLEGNTLYVMAEEIGPLTYTECQWASIQKIVLLSPDTKTGTTNRPESQGCTNDELFTQLCQGYNSSASKVYVWRDRQFENVAQKEWASRANRVSYNGKETDKKHTIPEKELFDSLFTPVPL